MYRITIFSVAGILLAFLAISEYIRFARAREEIQRMLQVQDDQATRLHWSDNLVNQLDSWTRIQGWERPLQKCYYVFRPGEWLFVLTGISMVMWFVLRWVLDSSWIGAGILSFILIPWIHKGWFWLGNIRYQSLLQPQILELCRFMGHAVQAGKSIRQAMESVADHLDSPLQEELQICRDELQMGIHLEQVLNQLEKRVDQSELYFFTRVLRLHMQTGLDLIYFMQRMSSLMEERFLIKKVIQSSIAQAKYTAILLPILSCIIVTVFSKLFGGYGLLFQSWMGLSAVVLFVGLQLLGFWMIYRISRFRGV